MSAQTSPAGLRPDDLYALRLAEDPRMSPDGRHVAYVVMRMDRDAYEYRREVWLAEADGGGSARISDGPHDASPRWSPDGSRIAFIRNPPPGTKPSSSAEADLGVGRGQLWICDADGSNLKQLTYLQGGAADPVWAPDGHSLVVCSAVGRADDSEAETASFAGRSLPAVRTITRLWYRSDGAGYTYERRSQLFRVATAGGGLQQLTDGDWDSRLASFSPDGRTLAFVSDRSPDRWRWPGGAIWLLDLAGGRAPRRLTPESVSCGRPVWSPDGSRIAYRGSEVLTSDGYVELFVVSAAGGQPRWVSEHFLPTCANVCLDDQRVPPGNDEPMWAPDGGDIRLLASAHGSVHLWALAADGSGWRQMTAGNRQVFAVTADRGGERLALGVSTPEIPGDVFVHDPLRDTDSRLTDLNSVLFAERALGQVTDFTVTASDGIEVQGWEMRPAGAPATARLPAVLQVHGGPMAMYGWTFCLEFQVLAGLGLAVVYGNPRGSVGYGREFSRAIAHHWGERDHQDLVELMDAALARGGIDRQRTGVAGGSYGGFMALWMLGHDDTGRWKTGVAMRSLSNWATFFGSSDIGPRFTLLEAGATPWSDLDRLMQHSPISFVERIRAPLLLLHSEADLRCPIVETEQVYAALAYLGRPVVFVRFEGQSHDLSRNGHPRSRELRLRHIAEWFNDHLAQRRAASEPAAALPEAAR